MRQLFDSLLFAIYSEVKLKDYNKRLFMIHIYLFVLLYNDYLSFNNHQHFRLLHLHV